MYIISLISIPFHFCNFFSFYFSLSATRQERSIAFNDIRVHPDYDPNTFDNDIALVPMVQPVQYTNDIRPACLADEAPADGTEVVISGWGTISAGGPQSAVLKEAKVLYYGFKITPYICV